MNNDQFRESFQRFQNIDGNKFGACLREVKDENILLQFRIKLDGTGGCWIQFWSNGLGYNIFEPENTEKGNNSVVHLQPEAVKVQYALSQWVQECAGTESQEAQQIQMAWENIKFFALGIRESETII